MNAAAAICLGAVLLGAAFLGGCASSPVAPAGPAARGEFIRICTTAAHAGQAAAAEPSLPAAEAEAAAAELLARGYSPTAIPVAGVIGALPSLRQYAALEAGNARGQGAELRLLGCARTSWTGSSWRCWTSRARLPRSTVKASGATSCGCACRTPRINGPGA